MKTDTRTTVSRDQSRNRQRRCVGSREPAHVISPGACAALERTSVFRLYGRGAPPVSISHRCAPAASRRHTASNTADSVANDARQRVMPCCWLDAASSRSRWRASRARERSPESSACEYAKEYAIGAAGLSQARSSSRVTRDASHSLGRRLQAKSASAFAMTHSRCALRLHRSRNPRGNAQSEQGKHGPRPDHGAHTRWSGLTSKRARTARPNTSRWMLQWSNRVSDAGRRVGVAVVIVQGTTDRRCVLSISSNAATSELLNRASAASESRIHCTKYALTSRSCAVGPRSASSLS